MGASVDDLDNTTNNTEFPYNPVDGQTVFISGITYYFDANIGAWLRTTPKYR